MREKLDYFDWRSRCAFEIYILRLRYCCLIINDAVVGNRNKLQDV